MPKFKVDKKFRLCFPKREILRNDNSISPQYEMKNFDKKLNFAGNPAPGELRTWLCPTSTTRRCSRRTASCATLRRTRGGYSSAASAPTEATGRCWSLPGRGGTSPTCSSSGTHYIIVIVYFMYCTCSYSVCVR